MYKPNTICGGSPIETHQGANVYDTACLPLADLNKSVDLSAKKEDCNDVKDKIERLMQRNSSVECAYSFLSPISF